ncbi:unnamed protein product [Oncorhynchus mykiss]|uniref:Plexin cytoplasmic RasGAP domain-containing protein n=1 Tax=Oncorhynchus mykiss TaxID=8022 RepID=A0A060XBN2_ONCMY|nr:unnamed protein product [Oncorhynchus mykiss]
MQINYLKIIQCDFLDFCFRFCLSQLKCTYDKKLQTSTCFVSRKTCKIGSVSNTCSPHCRLVLWFQDSPTNKLLYAKEIPEYKKRVQCYYKQIHEMAPLSEQEMNAHLAEESRKYRNEFNTNLALTEIYKYAKKYRNQVVSALESNPTAKRTQLHHKFEQVIALVEDNIYECSSEA